MQLKQIYIATEFFQLLEKRKSKALYMDLPYTFHMKRSLHKDNYNSNSKFSISKLIT